MRNSLRSMAVAAVLLGWSAVPSGATVVPFTPFVDPNQNFGNAASLAGPFTEDFTFALDAGTHLSVTSVTNTFSGLGAGFIHAFSLVLDSGIPGAGTFVAAGTLSSPTPTSQELNLSLLVSTPGLYFLEFKGIGDAVSNFGGTISTFEAGSGGSTPLPAALPLFATGMGIMSLLGWRKKRKGGHQRLAAPAIA